VLSTLFSSPTRSEVVISGFQFPLKQYVFNDGCLEWGELNSEYQICGKAGQHLADDVCRPAGTDVFSCGDGVIMYAHSYKQCPNWGSLIIVEHLLPDNSRMCTIYGHVEPETHISAGDNIRQGQLIGKIDHFSCWADHIHFSVYDGPYTDIECDPNELYCYANGYMCQDNWPGQYRKPDSIVAARAVEYWRVASGSVAVGTPQASPFSDRHCTENDAHWFVGCHDVSVGNDFYIQYYSSPIYAAHSAIVFDVKKGARHAIWIHSDFFDKWFNGGETITSHRLALGMPITNPYEVSTGILRQDFQQGYIKDGTILGYDVCAPGWTQSGWNPQYSYLFADAYDRNGAARDVGEAFAGAVSGSPAEVHEWQFTNKLGEPDIVWIQNFRDDSNREGAIMYDPDNIVYNPLATNEAYYIYDEFWWRYILTNNPDNGQNGVAGWGFVTRDRYQWPEGSNTWRMDFVFPGEGSLDVRGHYMLYDPNDDVNDNHISWHCLGSEVVTQYPAGPPDVLTLQPNEASQMKLLHAGLTFEIIISMNTGTIFREVNIMSS